MRSVIKQTDEFARWLEHLRDQKAALKILARIKNAAAGNFGDCKPIGEGLSETRIDYGPGYRLYYGQIGRVVFLLLLGGDKGSQSRDVAAAKTMWRRIKEEGYDDQD